MTKLLLTIGIVLLATVGCSTAPEPIEAVVSTNVVTTDHILKSQGLGTTSITRYTDHEYEVICWGFRNGYGGGLSCIPLHQLNQETNSGKK